MEKTLQSLDASLSTLIDGTTEKGAKLIEFLYAQAPDVIAQLLLFHGVESAVKCFIGVLLIIGGPLAIYFAGKKYYNFLGGDEKGTEEEPTFWIPTIFASLIIAIPSLINGWQMVNLTWLKIWIAPKVYLLEWIANVAK
jgi:hypothetical protein